MIFLGTLVFSCNKQADPNDNQVGRGEGTYIDVPFVQEYHEGYIVDEQTPGANDVRAIQADRNDNIWIATKAGVYMKNRGSRHVEINDFRYGSGPCL